MPADALAAEDLALLERLARRVAELRLETPAILTLETARPLSLVAGQAMLFLEPLAQMLFRFDETATQCMWMKNTLIPLSVAFIDEAGAIINIADMQPHSEQSHCAARPARYALEMNQGWFAQRGIKPGAKLGGLEKLTPR